MVKNPPPDSKALTRQKKWSFIETSKKIIKNQVSGSVENERESTSQGDNLSEGEPVLKELLKTHSPKL
ncbi:hypothetical protein TUM19329_09600 [Legionella antarctica]|uniref:Uncharacterized protein n=1 Tax=Legionella antarctica TaxID=2708020 RepID=A0A6F8T2E4_9GAMM|nr:hypothetical protein [Legionella antarctica]BCA94599.1 hypothetical protein TUM19329_09600 [Legionella antarctica]